MNRPGPSTASGAPRERLREPPNERPEPHKVRRPTRWLLCAGLVSSFAGGLLILGMTLKSYYEVSRLGPANRVEDLAPGVHEALLVGGPILAVGIATTIAGLVIRLIAVALRSHPPDANAVMARVAAAFLEDGLTGFDLAGQEEAFPDPLVHARAFEIAREGGLGITIHAGEWGGAEQVRRSLQAVSPMRIAHGARAADDPSLMADLIARGVTLDVCPTSNVQASIFATLADFPLRALIDAGVGLTLSTDDRTVSDLTLVREYERAHDTLGASVAELWAMNRHALEVAFLHDDEALRARLIAEFDTWASQNSEVLSPS